MRVNKIAAAGLALCLAAATAAVAHEVKKGRNGGVVSHGGKYHTELVVDGTPTVSVFVSDANDKPLETQGFKANAILVIDGRSQRFELAPAGGARLVGTAPAPVKPGVKGAIQLTAPDGTTAQSKY